MGSMSVPTYLLVDGENIDATLGMSVLGRRPEPEERPRWDRVLAYCDELSSADATEGEGNEARALFFLNATSGHMPMSFIQALLAMDYRPVPLAGSGSNEEKVVDIGIQRTLEALAEPARTHTSCWAATTATTSPTLSGSCEPAPRWGSCASGSSSMPSWPAWRARA